MTEQQNVIPQQELEDEIDIMEMIRKLIKEWKLILVWAAVAAVCGVIIAISNPKSYTVETSLVPEVKGAKSSGGGLSSLASLAGINLSAGGGADAVSPMLYPNIVNSTQFMSELFDLPVEIVRHGKTVETDLYTYYKEYQHKAWWSYIISAPGYAIKGVMSIFRGKEEEVEGYADFNPAALTLEQAKMVKAMNKSINVSLDNKTSLMSLSVTAQDASVAFAVCNKVIQNLEAHIQTYRTEKARNDLNYYQQLYDEAKEDYHVAQKKYASYLDSNQGVVLQRVLVEGERLQNESQLAFQLYNSCAQQLQMAKATIQEEKPVCVVIDPPTKLVKPSSISGMKLLFIMIFLGICLAGVWILFGRDWIENMKKSV